MRILGLFVPLFGLLVACGSAAHTTSSTPATAHAAPHTPVRLDPLEVPAVFAIGKGGGGGGGVNTCTAAGASCTRYGTNLTVDGCTITCAPTRTAVCLDAFCGTTGPVAAICRCSSGGGGPIIVSR